MNMRSKGLFSWFMACGNWAVSTSALAVSILRFFFQAESGIGILLYKGAGVRSSR